MARGFNSIGSIKLVVREGHVQEIPLNRLAQAVKAKLQQQQKEWIRSIGYIAKVNQTGSAANSPACYGKLPSELGNH